MPDTRRFPILSLLLPAAVVGTGLSACGASSTSPALPTFDATLTGAAERPTPVTAPGTGTAMVVKNGASYTYTITYSGLTGVPTGAHIHGPAGASASAGVLVSFGVAGTTAGAGTVTGAFSASDIAPTRGISADSLEVLLRTGNSYVNVHTAANPGGEIRGQLVPR